MTYLYDMAAFPSLAAPGSVVVSDWHRCKESKEFFSKILQKMRRKNFGRKLTVSSKHNCANHTFTYDDFCFRFNYIKWTFASLNTGSF